MVHFVGAGSGAVDLITVRGARLLSEADVVIYAGSLVNPDLLSYTKEGCDIHDSAKMTLEQVIEVIKKAARKFIPDIEVAFSTYNWGFADEKDRIDLINNLPTDITLEATWDMFEQRKMKNSVQDGVDYSLNFVGPGKYFISEAKAAKARGIRLSTNAQSSGRTWDFGTVPYEPMPYQWMKRYEGMVKAHYDWGLTCVLENIHYGVQPSIISELEKYMFFTTSHTGRMA